MADVDWRGWTAAGADAQQVVTSGRLDPMAVRARFFPKTRSWFTLGAPLELLSPLSVLRVLFALAVVWPLIGFAGGMPARSTTAVVLAVTVVWGTTWLGLVRMSTVSSRISEVLVAELVIGSAVVIHLSASVTTLTIAYLSFGPAVALFAGLFFGGRGLRRYYVMVLAATWAALLPEGPFTATGLLAFAVTLMVIAITTTLRMLCRSARDQNGVDADTGLPNGFGLARRVTMQKREAFVVAVVHLSGLAEAREAFGYPAGTELLRRAVENVGQVIPGSIVGRVEGDELVVVLGFNPAKSAVGAKGPASKKTATATATAVADFLAEQLITAVSGGRYLVGGIEVALRAHIGAAVAPHDGDDVVDLIRQASLSARRAHHQGCVSLIRDDDTGALTSSDLGMLSELAKAIDRGELRLTYQPQVVPETSAIIGVEALVRWDSTRHGAVSPALFIPLAERTGLITRITDWVLGEALAAAARWAEAGYPLAVSVNLSAVDLGRVDLTERVLGEIAHHGIDPSRLTLEVTETAATVDMLQAFEVLRPVRQLGVRISVDDFGTGYTSLSLLPQLSLDELKVDQQFVLRCMTSPADNAIVESVCDLGHRLGIHVVAEGVEDGACAAHLTALGFDLLQGFAFARPLSESDLLALLRSEATLPPMTSIPA